MKVVINTCYGGFSVSEAAMRALGETTDGDEYAMQSQYPSCARNDPRLVAVVEEMGDAANGRSADLKVVEIPDDIQWNIAEYDGLEHIEEVHRTWH